MPQTTGLAQGKTLPRPRFLAALDNVHDPEDGSYVADCPICRDLLLIEDVHGRWRLTCDNGHHHDELVLWLRINDCRSNPSDDNRVWVALMLAPTPEIWAALLNGEPVADEALDQKWLARFRTAGVIA